jgi:CRP-like cAMP-binding protein
VDGSSTAIPVDPTADVRSRRPASAPILVDVAPGATAPLRTDAALVVVERGIVAVRAGAGTRTAVVTIAARGEVVPAPGRRERIESITAARVRVITKRELASLLGDPDEARWIVDGLSAALCDRQESLAHAAVPTHAERVEAKLRQLARRHGRVTPDGIRIDVPLTHQILADSIGAARETVTVALRDLRRRGLVVRRGRTYVLKIAADALA